MRTSEPATHPPTDEAVADRIRPSDDIVEDPLDHRRRTSRHVRHEAKAKLHELVGDEEGLEDADLLCPQAAHDLGRKTSKPPHKDSKPGRRSGFKVWKTPFWKRRTQLRAQRNSQMRRLAQAD
jgi:hypothetical protein